MDEDDDGYWTMTRWDTGDGEDGDLFAMVAGTFIIHLFDCDGDKRGNTAQQLLDTGEETAAEGSGGP